jgi:hypothetical protein
MGSRPATGRRFDQVHRSEEASTEIASSGQPALDALQAARSPSKLLQVMPHRSSDVLAEVFQDGALRLRLSGPWRVWRAAPAVGASAGTSGKHTRFRPERSFGHNCLCKNSAKSLTNRRAKGDRFYRSEPAPTRRHRHADSQQIGPAVRHLRTKAMSNEPAKNGMQDRTRMNTKARYWLRNSVISARILNE